MKIRAYLLATASTLALVGPATGADILRKAPVMSPVPIANWAGPYIGIHGGVARSDYTIHTGSDDGGSTHQNADTGGVFGGQIGYNWQKRYLVYGVELDASWANLKHSSAPNDDDLVMMGRTDWLASLRGRAGLAIEDTLVYLTGGVALARNGWSWGYIGDPALVDKRITSFGWVAGVGIEHMYSKNWTVRFELLHYDFEREDSSVRDESYISQFKNKVTVARLGFNYKW